MQLAFTYAMPPKRPFFQLPRTLHSTRSYHPARPVPSLLMLFSLVCLSDFLDLQLSWSSFLWLAHLYSLLFDRVHLWRLWPSLRLWHTPCEPRSYSSRSLRVRPISSAGISPHFLRWSVQSFDLSPTDPLCFFFNFLKFLNFFFPSQQKAKNLSFYSHYVRGGEVRSASCPYIGRRKSQAGKSICDQEDNWRHQDRHDTKWKAQKYLGGSMRKNNGNKKN